QAHCHRPSTDGMRPPCCLIANHRLEHGGCMPTPLPDRPNLEQLKKHAKSLLRDARAGDPAALDRFTELPAFTHMSRDELGAVDLALHDAQSVIARAHGFPSWNALREEVESRTLSFDAAVTEFVRCATGGASGRAERLL